MSCFAFERERDTPDQCLIDLMPTQSYSNTLRTAFISSRTEEWDQSMVGNLSYVQFLHPKNGNMTEQ